jgi:hypothetical protein
MNTLETITHDMNRNCLLLIGGESPSINGIKIRESLVSILFQPTKAFSVHNILIKKKRKIPTPDIIIFHHSTFRFLLSWIRVKIKSATMVKDKKPI